MSNGWKDAAERAEYDAAFIAMVNAQIQALLALKDSEITPEMVGGVARVARKNAEAPFLRILDRP